MADTREHVMAETDAFAETASLPRYGDFASATPARWHLGAALSTKTSTARRRSPTTRFHPYGGVSKRQVGPNAASK